MTWEGKTPTLENLAPLYQAIAHGSRAGRHEEALAGIYRDRICRRRADGRILAIPRHCNVVEPSFHRNTLDLLQGFGVDDIQRPGIHRLCTSIADAD